MIYFIDLVHILKKLANLDFHEIYLNLIFMKSTANIQWYPISYMHYTNST